MPVGVHHRGPEAHREPAKKSLEDREILGHGCGIYPRISRALRLIRGVGGTRGRLSESDPTWAANGVARHRTRRGSTWVDHVRSKGHVTRAGVTWDFRGGGRATCRGKSRGDSWDRYTGDAMKNVVKSELGVEFPLERRGKVGHGGGMSSRSVCYLALFCDDNTMVLVA